MTLKDHGIHHFVIEELAPPEVCNKYSEARILHWLDIRIVKAWEWIRVERGNPIYMNTWGVSTPDWYPDMTKRGLRVSEKAGHQTSQHHYGRALDGDEVGVDNKELYEFCLDNASNLITMGVTTIESIEFTTTWIHLDCRTLTPGQTTLNVVSP